MRMSPNTGPTRDGKDEAEHCEGGSTPVCSVEIDPSDIDAAEAMERVGKVEPSEKAGKVPGKVEKDPAGMARVTLEGWRAALGTTTVGNEGKVVIGVGATFEATDAAMETVGNEAMGMACNVLPAMLTKAGLPNVSDDRPAAEDVALCIPGKAAPDSGTIEELVPTAATGLIVIERVVESLSICWTWKI
jgi:hypothetical protein